MINLFGEGTNTKDEPTVLKNLPIILLKISQFFLLIIPDNVTYYSCCLCHTVNIFFRYFNHQCLSLKKILLSRKSYSTVYIAK